MTDPLEGRVGVLDMGAARAQNGGMADEKKPDPVDDLKKGLGLLFRAARTAVDELPTGKLEEAVKSGAREVGRAIENVTQTIDKELFHKKSAPPAADAKSADAKPVDAKPVDPKPEEKKDEPAKP